jgi:periodic tryptophan protein 1
MPICIEWLDFDPTITEQANSKVNYIAVGTLNPWIDIWDLDLMDSLEPEFTLGYNYESENEDETSTKKKKKKQKGDQEVKKKSKKSKLIGHKDAVLDLCYNQIEKSVLASASADKTIVLWDLQELKQATKIKHHKKNVQTLKFHPIESFSLLSGSADSTVCLYDCRNPNENKKAWCLSDTTAEVEQVLWNKFEPNQFLVSKMQAEFFGLDFF